MTTDLDALRRRAQELGVETWYWDVSGTLHHAPESTLRTVVDVLEADLATSGGPDVEPVVVTRGGAVAVGRLTDVALDVDGATVELTPRGGWVDLPHDLPVGCHRLDGSRPGATASATVVVPPPLMPRDDGLAGGAGLFVPTYALWELDEPLPSYGQLATLAASVKAAGIAVLSTLPLYAQMLDEPFDPSPYAPASRLHWNELYLGDAGLPRSGPVESIAASGELVDWAQLARRRRGQLLGEALRLDADQQAALDAFVAARPDVAAFATFAAGRRSPHDAGAPAALVERSHHLAQYLADRQLGGVEGDGRAVLALDLPIGSHPDGFETWAYGERFAPGTAVGAPPDDFFAEGQNWGFPPTLPGAGRRSGHDLWRRLIARAGEHASMLRVDHVMGVQRLWWIPEGASAADGVYVRYPREELLAVIAAEAHRAGTTVVGENLGTVSDEVRDALDRWEMIGMHEEQFLLRSHHLGEVPARSVAGIRTHDMPAFAAAVVEADPDDVDRYRRLLGDWIGRPVGSAPAELFDAALERLCRSAAYVVLVDLDDLVGETAPHNVPGRVLPHTWRRRLRRPTSAVLAGDDVRHSFHRLTTRGCAR